MARQHIFGVDFDRLTLDETVSRLSEVLGDSARACRYVVTPNVDHLVQLRSNAALNVAYRDAMLIVVDSRPIVFLSRLLQDPLPGAVPGSDLFPALLDRTVETARPLSLYLLGAGPGVADRAAAMIEQQWPTVRVVGTLSPPFGFENDEAEIDRIVQSVNACSPDLLVIALGAPKQELLIHRLAPVLDVKLALCIGAALDFMAGEKPRAPTWMRHIGMEWAFRILTEPRRLLGRYTRDALMLPRIILDELLFRRRRGR